MKTALACILLLALIACTPILAPQPVQLKPADCPSYLRYYEGECVPIITCPDGTLYPACSKNRPYKCNVDGALEEAAANCGCPRNFTSVYGVCEPIKVKPKKPNYHEFAIQLNNSRQYWVMPPEYQDAALYNITINASDAVQIITFPGKFSFASWKNNSPTYLYVEDCSSARPTFSREITLKGCCLDGASALIVLRQEAPFPANIRLRMTLGQHLSGCDYDPVIPQPFGAPSIMSSENYKDVWP